MAADTDSSPMTHTPASAQALPLSRQLVATAQAWSSVRAGTSATQAIAAVPAALRPGVQALLWAVLRHGARALALRQRLAPRRPAAKVDALLCVALALLHANATQTAAAAGVEYAMHTLVDQAVAAARQWGLGAQAGFINACLRRAVREHDVLMADIVQSEQAHAHTQDSAAMSPTHNHPHWWVRKLRKQYPDDWQRILSAAQVPPPMTLRLSRRAGLDMNAAVAELAAAGVGARAIADALCSDAVVLDKAVSVQALPGFDIGRWSVQDAAAQLAAPLLLAERSDAPSLHTVADPARGLRILDACAAPGGKSAHVLDLALSAWEIKKLDTSAPAMPHLTALDIDPTRCERINQTLQRTHCAHTARVVCADAAQPAAWWDVQRDGLLDAIVLDAPCTASGIVRRHPDIVWLRREADVAQLARTQAALLRALWPLLKVGGRLLYATCSVFKEEGLYQIEKFCAAHADARWLPTPGHLLPTSAPTLASQHKSQTTQPLPRCADDAYFGTQQSSALPLSATAHDGFFYALLCKQPA